MRILTDNRVTINGGVFRLAATAFSTCLWTPLQFGVETAFDTSGSSEVEHVCHPLCRRRCENYRNGMLHQWEIRPRGQRQNVCHVEPGDRTRNRPGGRRRPGRC